MIILSPAGNFECLKAAVYNGANEVYLGINNFNARNNINGFSIEELETAVNFAHIHGVKVNLAINILFSDEELQEALNTVVDAYNLGVDYFIIQDLGLAKLISENYPSIILHASTQMGIHNLEGVLNILPFGFKRIVLARETPLEEIKRIKNNCNIELEYFVQGALCVSFSGNCYLSSYLNDASGNRGKCKQLCRLPFSLLKNNKIIKKGYLLSAKDFNMINRLDDLKKAGVDVIKIEGRARRPFYVASATKEYYNALNNLTINQTNLELAFNRTYTEGYFNGNENIISDLQNHIGVQIGKVLNVKLGKKFNEITISSNRQLYPKSTFKIFSNNTEKTTLTAYDIKETSANIYVITSTQTVNKGDFVNLIIDSNLEQNLLNNISKRPIEINIIANKNKPISAIVSINNNKITINGPICPEAIKQPLTKDEIINNFAKNEHYSFIFNKITLDDIFLTKQQLNNFRREVINTLSETIIEETKRSLKKVKVKTTNNFIKFINFQIVENINEKFVQENVIYSPEEYNISSIETFINKCKKEFKNPFLDTPNFALKKDIVLLKNIIEQTQIPIVANNYYALSLTNNNVIGAGLNVYNSITASIFNKPIITAESNISTKIKFPYMTLRHCPLKNHLNATCSNCPYNNDFTYKMENGKILKLKRKKLSSCTFYLTD